MVEISLSIDPSQIAGIARQIGMAVDLLDLLDCDLETTKRRIAPGYGFVPLTSNPMRMVLPVGATKLLLE
jgi:hypothetical protein